MNKDELVVIHVGLIARDPVALVAFEADLRPLVRGYLRKKGASDEDADEIWNDAFLAVIDRAGTIKPLGLGLKPFALSVANRRWIDRLRLSARMPTQSLPDDPSAPTPSTSPPDPERMAAVATCSEGAKPIYREVLEMVSRGLTASEIATVLEISEANAAKIRARAKAWYRECLEGKVSHD
jgi:RNA polymerase sigma factor (sigma-70 family)